MPVPCTNCVRFHYGECFEEVRNCNECGGVNHIERYCPNKKNFIRNVPGEPLAGTRAWQEMHNLDHDQELRFKVLQSLKTSPGTAIHVNGVCIYPGYEKHFVKEETRRRSLDDRIRKRSVSPNYSRLSRSPPRDDRQRENRQHWGRVQSPPRPSNNGYRQRSPLRRARRTPSPYRHASPPSFCHPRRLRHISPPSSYYPRRSYDRRYPRRAASSSDDVVFLSERPVSYQDRRRREAEKIFPIDIDKMNYTPKVSDVQRGLRVTSANVPKVLAPGKTNQSNGKISPVKKVDDPYFVLGVTKSAGDAAILEAYQERMREVRTEKALEIDMDAELSNDYAYSIRLLQAAKDQLIGGGSGFTH